LLNRSLLFNDYDYALVHLFEEHEEYFQFYINSLKKKRDVILDNSVFELGEAYDEKKYRKWIGKLRPTYYIIPDKFGDADFTINKIKTWEKEKGDKIIGVVQGSTIEEMVRCYLEIKDHVDKIAISFAQQAFSDIYANLPLSYARMYGRIYFINFLKERGYINKDKEHHLLGCSLPQEFLFYKDNFSFITSVDTSSPILHGWFNVRYNDYGLVDKLNTKLIDIFEKEIRHIDTISFNISKFKNFAS
jgi:hypothetical protein